MLKWHKRNKTKIHQSLICSFAFLLSDRVKSHHFNLDKLSLFHLFSSFSLFWKSIFLEDVKQPVEQSISWSNSLSPVLSIGTKVEENWLHELTSDLHTHATACSCPHTHNTTHNNILFPYPEHIKCFDLCLGFEVLCSNFLKLRTLPYRNEFYGGINTVSCYLLSHHFSTISSVLCQSKYARSVSELSVLIDQWAHLSMHKFQTLLPLIYVKP